MYEWRHSLQVHRLIYNVEAEPVHDCAGPGCEAWLQKLAGVPRAVIAFGCFECGRTHWCGGSTAAPGDPCPLVLNDESYQVCRFSGKVNVEAGATYTSGSYDSDMAMNFGLTIDDEQGAVTTFHEAERTFERAQFNVSMSVRDKANEARNQAYMMRSADRIVKKYTPPLAVVTTILPPVEPAPPTEPPTTTPRDRMYWQEGTSCSRHCLLPLFLAVGGEERRAFTLGSMVCPTSEDEDDAVAEDGDAEGEEEEVDSSPTAAAAAPMEARDYREVKRLVRQRGAGGATRKPPPPRKAPIKFSLLRSMRLKDARGYRTRPPETPRMDMGWLRRAHGLLLRFYTWCQLDPPSAVVDRHLDILARFLWLAPPRRRVSTDPIIAIGAYLWYTAPHGIAAASVPPDRVLARIVASGHLARAYGTFASVPQTATTPPTMKAQGASFSSLMATPLPLHATTAALDFLGYSAGNARSIAFAPGERCTANQINELHDLLRVTLSSYNAPWLMAWFHGPEHQCWPPPTGRMEYPSEEEGGDGTTPSPPLGGSHGD